MSFKKYLAMLKPWLFWSLGASFFFTEYFARVGPSIMVPQLMSAFHVGAFALGSLSAFFYYPYVLMQIPVGSLTDRFRPRYLLSGAAAVCAIGAFIFAIAHNVPTAELARAIIGFGAAFAFVGTLKIATIWFEPRKLGLLAGLTQGLGMLGAAVGEGLFAVFVSTIGWRATMSLIGAILLLVAALIMLVMRGKQQTQNIVGAEKTHYQMDALAGLKVVFRNPYSWLIALYAGLIYAPTGAFAELWGPSYLYRTYGLSHDVSALAISCIFLGLAVGCPLFGWVTDRLTRRTPALFCSGLMSLLWLSLVLFTSHLPIWLVFVFLFLYGLSNAGVAISYAVAGELNPPSVSGVSIAFTNMTSILLGALFQPAIGWLLSTRESIVKVGGVPFYSAHDYRSAMAILPVCLLAATLLSVFIRENVGRKVHE